MIKFFLIFSAVLAVSGNVSAQVPFKAYDSYEELVEQGTVHNLVVDCGTERVTIRVPRSFSAMADNQEQSVSFHQDAGDISIRMIVTTNSPGAMPRDEVLRQMALTIDPNESYLQVGSCATGYKPARYVDSIHAVSPNRLVRTRHAFVSCPDGLVEFIYSAKDEAFNDGRVIFNLFVSSLHLEKVAVAAEKPSR